MIELSREKCVEITADSFVIQIKGNVIRLATYCGEVVIKTKGVFDITTSRKLTVEKCRE